MTSKLLKSNYNGSPNENYSPKLLAAAITGVILVLFVILMILPIGLNPLRKTPADKIAISYGGGPFEGNEYQRIVNPGSGITFNGWFDKWYEYPTTQRNYIVSSDPAEGDRAQVDHITAKDANRVNEDVELTVTFKLNTSKLRPFHEQIGLKYEAWEDEGWDKMLGDNFRQPLNNAVLQKIREYTTDQIASSTEVLPAVQAAIEATLKNDVTQLLGDEYFCGPTYELNSTVCPNFKVVIKSINPPGAVSDSYNDQKVSGNRVTVAQNDAQAQIERAKGEKASQDAVAPALTPAYLEYLQIQAYKSCAEHDKCVLVVNGSGSGVNVNVPAG